MEANFEKMLDKVIEELKVAAKTETVIGEQFKLGEFTCVPVIRIGMGFGGGGGEGQDTKQGKGTGGGAGAGIGIEPIAFLVSKGDEISVLPVRKSSGLAAAFEKAPELIEKFLEKKEAKSETTKTE